jgi:predicted ATPase
MALSDEMRKLDAKWTTGNSWPKWLEWLEINRIRKWSGQRIEFKFPIVAIVGENGSGKSTILQSASCVYQSPDSANRTWFPSEFFPETAWDDLQDLRINYGYRQAADHLTGSIRKPTTRWLGQPERPQRRVSYIDLSRLQPVATRVGYARIAKTKHSEHSSIAFSEGEVNRLSGIMGRDYQQAKMAKSSIDDSREIPVLTKDGDTYSGFHQGSGETTIAELVRAQFPKYGLVLIDEIESSLHPRAQRRLMRDLASLARHLECQIIITTHSPYVLEELPLAARIYIIESGGEKNTVNGVSPQFAMTKMDDHNHPECELYVEDDRSRIFLQELLSRHARDIFIRCSIIPYGAANLGVSLGQMVAHNRFPRPTRVFLDGDQDEALGCIVLPGSDSPERVVFRDLRDKRWGNLWSRIARDISNVQDACERAMTLGDDKEWVRSAANELMCGSDVLWQAMCLEWADSIRFSEIEYLIEGVRAAFI